MFHHWLKQKSTCTFTINALRIPEYTSDGFQIEWKRGEVEGLTEMAFANDNNEVFYDKTFKCPVTMYSKDNQNRPKIINFTVNRIKEATKKKVFGKIEVDVSPYFGITPKSHTFEVQSPHSKKSYVVLTITTTPDQIGGGDFVGTEGDLTSNSEIVNMQSEKIEDWDISEFKNEVDQKRTEEFFQMYNSTRATSMLSQFQSTPRIKRNGSRSKLVELPTGSTPDLFTSVRMSPPRSKLNAFMSGKPNRPHRSSISNEELSRPPLIAPSALDEGAEDPRETAENLLRSVLMKQWGSSPIEINPVPRPSVAIYTALLHTKIFDEDKITDQDFELIKTDFFKRFRIAVFVNRATDDDRFVTVLYLILLLRRNGSERALIFANQMQKTASYYLDGIVRSLADSVSSIANQLIAGAVDAESLGPLFLEQINESIKQPSQFIKNKNISDFVGNRISNQVDAEFVNSLIRNPLRCTFGNAAQWNSFATVAASGGVELPLLREAAAVCMMGSALCADVGAKADICPKLPARTVAKLLANQQPDDFMPMPNDALSFIRAHGVDEAEDPSVPSDYRGDFSELSSKVDIDKWDETEFDDSTKESFSYLSSYLK